MANVFTKFTSTAQPVEIMYMLLGALTAEGWIVTSSGDGLAAYSSTGNVFTGFGSGANGLDNQDAWFVLQFPNSVRQIGFQRRLVSANWQAAYSITGTFSGGSATTVPTAPDQQSWISVWGSIGNGRPLFSETDILNVKICVQDTAPYAWWLVANIDGSLSLSSLLFCDFMVPGTTSVGETDSYVFFGGEYNVPGGLIANASGGQGQALSQFDGNASMASFPMPCGYTGYGTATETWRNVSWLGWKPEPGNGYDINWSYNLPNPFNGKLQMLLVPYGSVIQAGYINLTNPQWKGISSLFYNVLQSDMSPLDPVEFGDTLNVLSSKDYLCLGSVGVVWDGTDPVV